MEAQWGTAPFAAYGEPKPNKTSSMSTQGAFMLYARSTLKTPKVPY